MRRLLTYCLFFFTAVAASFFFFPSIVLGANLYEVTVNPSSAVKQGTSLNVTFSAPLSQNDTKVYDISINSANGNERWYWVQFTDSPPPQNEPTAIKSSGVWFPNNPSYSSGNNFLGQSAWLNPGTPNDPYNAASFTYFMQLNTAGLDCNPGSTEKNGTCTLKVYPVDKDGNVSTTDPPLATAQFIIDKSSSVPSSSPENVSLSSPSSTKWGESASILISNIPKGVIGSYSLTLTGPENSSETLGSVHITVDGQNCTVKIDGIFVKRSGSDQKCTSSAKPNNYYTTIGADFSKVRVPPTKTVPGLGVNIRSETYELTLDKGTGSTSKKSIVITYDTQFSIQLKTDNTIPPSLLNTKDTITPIYTSKSIVSLDIKGCTPNGHIDLKVVCDDKSSCLYTGDVGKIGGKGDGTETFKSSGNASYDADGSGSVSDGFVVGSPNSDIIYGTVTASCQESGTTATARFGAKGGENTEFIYADFNGASKLAANHPFNLIAGGLDLDSCYYIRIMAPDGTFSDKIDTKTDENDGDKGSQRCDHISEFPYFVSDTSDPKTWPPQKTIIVDGGLPNGLYTAILMRAASNKVFRQSFAVGITGVAGGLGALAGASIGSVVPIAGTAIGTVLGTGVGLSIGYNVSQYLVGPTLGSNQDERVAVAFFCIGGEQTSDCSSLPDPGKPPCDNLIASTFNKDDKSQDKCIRVNTALGAISTDPAGFITNILGILLSISGGIALLLIIRSGYQMMTSSGNPETIQEARDRITSAIVGLLFIIFSLVILQIIGIDILHIPGFQN